VEEVLMRSGRGERVRKAYAALRAWPLWGLPRWLTRYLMSVVGAYLVIVGAAARHSYLSTHGLIVLVGLLACLAATVELTKREGESAGHAIDVFGVWQLPVAILLPPLYALVVPALRTALTQWRVRQLSLYRRVFSAAVTGISYGIASVAFHVFTGSGAGMAVTPLAHPTVWVLAVAGSGAIRWLANVSLLMPAVKGADPTVNVRKLLLSRETVHNDLTEFCVAVLVTAGIAVSPLTILFALPFVTLLQRSFRHTQLVNASRIDSKTGLLNAGTWEREAASEVARAVRTRTPLAVALIDVDHFKAVNDVHGHLTGDKALSAVARTLTGFVREYDLVGRFGGEEFALLLPQTRAVDAYSIAERMRAHIATMPIPADGVAEPFKVSVSIGVAALGARWDTASGSQLTDLLAAADSALYQAKQSGRDQVCVITENATFGVHTRGGQGPLRLPRQPEGLHGAMAEPDPREHTSLPSALTDEASPDTGHGPEAS
jgi:diguanylate cyclase (GGDEF)-like protein